MAAKTSRSVTPGLAFRRLAWTPQADMSKDIAMINLPYYEDVELAKMDGWDLVNEWDEEWPWPDLTLPLETVRESHFQAFVLAKEILLHHQRVRPDREFRRWVAVNRQTLSEMLRPALKSWMDCIGRVLCNLPNSGV